MVGVLEIAVWFLLILASITDLLWGKIYNALTFPFIITGILARFFLSGTSGATTAILSVLLAFAIFFPLYFIKALAAGDVKLLMAIGAWIDASLTWKLAIVSILFGSAVGLFLMIRKKGAVSTTESIAEHFTGNQKKSFRIPYAPAFLCGFLFLRIVELKGWHFF